MVIMRSKELADADVVDDVADDVNCDDDVGDDGDEKDDDDRTYFPEHL